MFPHFFNDGLWCVFHLSGWVKVMLHDVTQYKNVWNDFDLDWWLFLFIPIYIYIICINKYVQIYIQYTIYNYTYTCISYCTCKHTQKHTGIVTLYICKWEPYMLTLLTVSFDTFQQNHAFFIEGHWQKCWECLDLLAISTTYMYLYTHVWIMYMHATWCIHN